MVRAVLADVANLCTVRDWLRWAVSRFNEAGLSFGHGTDNAVDEARYLVFACLCLSQDCGDWVLDARITAAEARRLQQWLDKRIRQRLPAPYITSEAWFAGLPFYVDRRVLVPRSPIAELISSGFSPWLSNAPQLQVLDLCCGSGCIGIACARILDAEQVVLVDISSDALNVARRNIAAHQLLGVCEPIQSDLFNELPRQRYHLIVCNPPYVDANEMVALAPEYGHEPRLGIEAGEDGLDIVRRILTEAREYLTDEGILVVEVGNSADALQDAFPDMPFLWLDFEHGGDGVFLLRAKQLD